MKTPITEKMTIGEKKWLERYTKSNMVYIDRLFKAMKDDSINVDNCPDLGIVQTGLAILAGKREYGTFTEADVDKLNDEEWLDLCGMETEQETEEETEQETEEKTETSM